MSALPIFYAYVLGLLLGALATVVAIDCWLVLVGEAPL